MVAIFSFNGALVQLRQATTREQINKITIAQKRPSLTLTANHNVKSMPAMNRGWDLRKSLPQR